MTTATRLLKPSLLFAAVSMKGAAHAATVIPTNYTLDAGVPVDITIGGNATAQYSFSYSNKTKEKPAAPPNKGTKTVVKGSTATITGNGGSLISKKPSSSAYYPSINDPKNPLIFTGSVDTNGKGSKFSNQNGYYGLLFDINGAQYSGYARVESGPTPAGSAFSDAAEGIASGLRISEIGYQAIAAVPEPETWAMMMIGLGGIGMTLRQRRRAQPGALARA